MKPKKEPQYNCGQTGTHKHYCKEVAELQHMLTLVRKHEQMEEIKKWKRQFELLQKMIAVAEMENKRLIAELGAK